MRPRAELGGPPAELATIGGRRRRWRVLRSLLSTPVAAVAALVLSVLFIVAIAAGWLAPYDPLERDRQAALDGPSLAHPFGTDNLGRDLFSRVIEGAPVSLRMAGTAILLGGVAGTFLGLIGGYFGRYADTAVVALADSLLAFPGLLLAMAIVAALGYGITNTAIAVGIAWVPVYIRVARGSVISTRELPYVEAARSIGCSDRRIIFRHILPNVVAPLIVVTSLGVGGAILVGAGLSFLGLGAQPPSPEWGSLVNAGRQYVDAAPWLIAFPGLMIAVTVVSLNVLGDWLRDVLDPHLRR